jgi:hypothetical protein
MDADYHRRVVASEHTGNVPERPDLKKWLVRRVECIRGYIVRNPKDKPCPILLLTTYSKFIGRQCSSVPCF